MLLCSKNVDILCCNFISILFNFYFIWLACVYKFDINHLCCLRFFLNDDVCSCKRYIQALYY